MKVNGSLCVLNLKLKDSHLHVHRIHRQFYKWAGVKFIMTDLNKLE